jgi:acyl-[acyl-carrier-protein]--UDP-N-acetylglucosamine O-acyltransferase
MMIHPTAVIEPGAQLGENVTVGAFAYIGAHVVLGDHCVVQHHATIDGYTTLGTHNTIFPYAFLGAKTHDLKYAGGTCYLKIGNENVFREYVSVHTATSDGDATVIGNKNYILAFTHIGHDCHLGNDIIMSAQIATGGHVHIGDCANIGGNSSIHQFCHIGAYAMLGGHSFLKKDIPPFMIASGVPAVAKSYNRIGILRKGFSEEERVIIKQMYKLMYESDLNRSQAIERIRQLPDLKHDSRIYKTFFDFIQQPSNRGLV